MWSACAVMISCFTTTFEIQCAWEHVHCITRGITHAHISNTYCTAWRAVHMVSLAIYAKNNCTLWLHPSARPPHGTTHSTWTPNTSVVFTRGSTYRALVAAIAKAPSTQTKTRQSIDSGWTSSWFVCYNGTFFCVLRYYADTKWTRTTTRIWGRPDPTCTTNENPGDRRPTNTGTNDCHVAFATDWQQYRHDHVAPVILRRGRLTDTVLRFKRPLHVVTG